MEQMDRLERAERAPSTDRPERPDRNGPRPERPNRNRGERPDRGERTDGPVSEMIGFRRNGRRGRNRFRRPGGGGGGGGGGGAPAGVPNNEPVFDRNPTTITPVEGAILGWFDPSRDGGFLRRPQNSYLPEPTDPFIPPALVRLHQLRRGDKLEVSYGRDQRGRHVVIEVLQLNDGSPVVLDKRPDFNTLTASYPDRKLTLETGKPAKTKSAGKGPPPNEIATASAPSFSCVVVLLSAGSCGTYSYMPLFSACPTSMGLPLSPSLPSA
jgi:transcription termination factor Rho